MNPLKRLAGQTAIYGISSILGRIINFLLVPLYTRIFVPEEYGVVTVMYTFVAVLLVLLTYGMETAFFRFSEKSPQQRDTIFSTSLFSVLSTSALFMILVLVFRHPIATAMRYPDHMEYVVLLGMIVGLDAISAIPFARLRASNKALKFVVIKLAGILMNIGMVLFFLLLCPRIMADGSSGLQSFVGHIYHPSIGVGYVFIANLIATVFTLALLLPDMLSARARFDRHLLRQMLVYSLPLMVAGLAGWVNEALDKLLLRYLLPEHIAAAEVGIYGAVYKLSIMMTIFIQAFRFAAEPFFFSQAATRNARELYARIMNYFVAACLLIFLGITLFIDIVKHFIGPEYHEGLPIVPILLLANLFLGVYFNLSIWYKLTGQTRYGAYFSIIGALITILLNLLLIPRFGYAGSAWTTLICYSSLALLSYWYGQKHFAIPYHLGRLFSLISAAIAIYFISQYTSSLPAIWMYVAHLGMMLAFCLISIGLNPDLLVVFQGVKPK